MKVNIALVQMSFSTDPRGNTERGAGFIRQAGAEGASIVCLPELATTHYFCYELNRDYYALAEPVPGPSTKIMAEAAREAGVYVVFPLYERGDDRQLYNTAAFIDPRGEVVGLYRKNSIPLAQMPEINGLEKYYFRPGNLGYPVFRTDLGIKVGITICYDRHFPEGPRSLALAGADVIFVPTATPTGRDLWEVELRGHAIANLLWVVGVNRVGRDEGGGPADFYGDSLVCGPDGKVVARAEGHSEQIVHAQIDTEHSASLRELWGFFRDRRPDAYGALTAP